MYNQKPKPARESVLLRFVEETTGTAVRLQLAYWCMRMPSLHRTLFLYFPNKIIKFKAVSKYDHYDFGFFSEPAEISVIYPEPELVNI
jgi:hypothetical protein